MRKEQGKTHFHNIHLFVSVRLSSPQVLEEVVNVSNGGGELESKRRR